MVKPIAKKIFYNPSVRNVARNIGKEVLTSGASVASDIIAGVPASEAVGNEIANAKGRLSREIKNRVARSRQLKEEPSYSPRVYGPVKRKSIAHNPRRRKKPRDIFS